MNYGNFFKALTEKREDTPELIACMERTVHGLLSSETTVSKPGMLLGKIQSGKTRAFIGVMALAFDNNYDVSIILTKGTKALLKQTVERLEDDFEDFIKNDEMQVFDIMNFPNNLTDYELNQKLVIVVKKEINNMRKVIENLMKTYPDLGQKKILIIDDEADFASVSFRKINDAIEVGKISAQIDELRRLVSDTDYLQVTATPYSLYLQPDMKIDDGMKFIPNRPAFTELVPIHDFYIGGDFYFYDSEDTNSIAHYIFEEVPLDERDVMKKEDGRRFKIEDVLTSNSVSVIRRAIVNFITAATIRRLQQRQAGEREEKYAFVAHSEISKDSHKWQQQIIDALVNELKKSSTEDIERLNKLLLESYEDLSRSAGMVDPMIPEYEIVKDEVYASIQKGWIMTTVVNSEKEVEELLDKKGQLKLRTPINIFIGGQILDRGITIQNLIGFYYGRNPKNFQQDTVLQHSRMYGSRNKEDLAVTRFYTTHDIYTIMARIHDFDSALRMAFEKGDHKNGVYFIRKDVTGKLAPCSPNKLLLSSLTTLKPYKRLLPVGFQTDYKTKIQKAIDEIDNYVRAWFDGKDREKPVQVDLVDLVKVIQTIKETLVFDNEAYQWDVPAFISSIEHLSVNSLDETQQGKVWVLVREDRNLSRFKSGGVYSDAPDTPKVEGVIAKEFAIDIPIVMLFRQNGLEENGWKGGAFWWPVMMAPQNTQAAVFAGETRV